MKEGYAFFQGVIVFTSKNKQKSEIFNSKNNL